MRRRIGQITRPFVRRLTGTSKAPRPTVLRRDGLGLGTARRWVMARHAYAYAAGGGGGGLGGLGGRRLWWLWRQHRATSSHSITSSARASTVEGISRPSALAVLRLIASRYFVGACTGRSAGFSPLRMRSTYP